MMKPLPPRCLLFKTLRLERLWNDPDAVRARLAELEEAA